MDRWVTWSSVLSAFWGLIWAQQERMSAGVMGGPYPFGPSSRSAVPVVSSVWTAHALPSPRAPPLIVVSLGSRCFHMWSLSCTWSMQCFLSSDGSLLKAAELLLKTQTVFTDQPAFQCNILECRNTPEGGKKKPNKKQHSVSCGCYVDSPLYLHVRVGGLGHLTSSN